MVAALHEDAARRRTSPAPDLSAIRCLLEQVVDPEIPSLTIADMGILREVRCDGSQIVVVITPTYSGCPAMAVIESDIRSVLQQAGFGDLMMETRLAPAWTTDWLSPAAREKLRIAGIAPPAASCGSCNVVDIASPACPQCGATETSVVSRYGATPCKAMYRCDCCLEPFEHFKTF